MKHLLLSALLLGLASCGESTRQGPNGCQVTGRSVTAGKGDFPNYSITYTVTGFQSGDTAIQKFLDRVGYSSISQEDEVGAYRIDFIDQSTGRGVHGMQAEVIEDELDRRHKISYR